MKTVKSILAAAALIGVGMGLGMSISRVKAETTSPELVYELRTYYTEEGKLPALHARFRDHTMRLFSKYGIKNVVYTTPVDEAGKPVDNKLVYLIGHKSLEAATASFAAFRQDPEWVTARDASEKDGKIVSKRESQFLVPTDYSPMK